MATLSAPQDVATVPDSALLREFIETRSESAFTVLVARHTVWVYSTALRIVRDPHLAEDVTQAVFVLLARKAARLSAGVRLTGWIFLTTRNIARHALRAEARRRKHERNAATMNPTQISPNSDDDESLAQLRPHVDAALGQLSEVDRDALLLRFYRQKSLGEVGSDLGLTEEAARKRISRALAKLRDRLSRRGVSLPATTLPILLEKLTHSAPGSLAATSAHAALSTPPAHIASLAAARSKSFLRPALGLAGAAIIALVIILFSQTTTTPSLVAAPTTQPAVHPIKVGWLVSQYLARSPGYFGRGVMGYQAHVTAIHPRFVDPQIELYALVEPDSLDNTQQADIISKNFLPDHTLIATDPDALAKMDVIVISRNFFYLRADIEQAIVASVKNNGTGVLIHVGDFDEELLSLSKPNLSKPNYFWTRKPVPCEIVTDHPLLSGLKGKLDIANLNGAMGVIQNGTPLIKALDLSSSNAPVPDEAIHPTTQPAPAMYPLYVASLGKGLIVNCNWDSIPGPLLEASKGRFYIHCCQYLAHKPLD